MAKLDVVEEKKVEVFKSAASRNFTIKFGNKTITKADIDVFSVSGEIIMEKTVQNINSVDINLSNFESGPYLFKIWFDRHIYNHLVRLD